MSPEPQTPSKPRQSGFESRVQSTPSTGSQSVARSYSHTSRSDRVLRSARQATPTSSQVNRRFPGFQTSDEDDELTTRVINLLEGFNIQLNSKQKRKLQVLVDDYIEDMGKGPSKDNDEYVVK
ncbi:hypothetical protein GQ44DRAFT_733426 [Phaeosphaeriaceae sp. PMI808]|nr:hypothetical protein GQ44DRAFT_733426 [Phaeosphaeriaceae sp. PMI808]